MQSGTADNRNGNREQEISMISRQLKALSKELNIPVLAMSQLSRAVENRVGNKPQLSDLRESGAIEQDVDIVCFIHRQEYYTKSSVDAEGHNIKGVAEFIVAKHRSGATDTINLRFVSRFARFENEDENNVQGNETTYESKMNAGDDPGPMTPIDNSAPQPPMPPNEAWMSDSNEEPIPF